jgi:tetratricopeptide (TPR) repeat protein
MQMIKPKHLVLLFMIPVLVVSCAPATVTQTAIPASATFRVSDNTPITIPPTLALVRPTVTRTLVPTFTPNTASLNPESYKLQSWSAEKADLMIAQVLSHLRAEEDNSDYQGVYGFSYYMEQFEYLAFAEMEALFRFPDAPQAIYWKWDLCYNLAFSYLSAESIDAPELPCYARLIQNGLNSGETNLRDLSDWFSSREARFSFDITSLGPLRGYSSAHVITLEYNAILLVLEKGGVFDVQGLMSNMFFYRESSSKFQLLDLTGDDFPEIIIYFNRSHCCGSWSSHFIYEFPSGRPYRLFFENLDGSLPYVSSAYDSEITSLDKSSEPPGLLFNGHYDKGDPLFQPCNLRKYEKYYWDNDQFELVETWLGIDPPDKYDDIEFCNFVLETATEQGELNMAVEAISSIQVGAPDIKMDQMLYRLGEYHARLGNSEKAKGYFAKAIATRELSGEAQSQWAENAQLFLDGYENNDAYYITCSVIADCNMQDALREIIAGTQPESFSIIVESLKDRGIPIKASGYMDMDFDTDGEQWIVVNHPNRSQNELWSLVKTPNKVYSLFLTTITTTTPGFKTFNGSNKIELSTANGRSLFSLERLSLTDHPYILLHNDGYSPLDDETYMLHSSLQGSLDDITVRLMNGANPAQLKDALIEMETSKTYNCAETTLCAELYYLLGLTNELLGDDQAAVEVYLQLWKTSPESIYTIMARSKLEQIPQ